MIDQHRDQQLGDALESSLPVPEHKDDYFDELRNQLEASAESPSDLKTRHNKRIYLYSGALTAASIAAVVALASMPTVNESPDLATPETTLPPVSVAPPTSAEPELTLAQVVTRKVSSSWRNLSGIEAEIEEFDNIFGKAVRKRTEVRMRDNGDTWARSVPLSGDAGVLLREYSYRAATGDLEELLEQKYLPGPTFSRTTGQPDGAYGAAGLTGYASAVRSLVASSNPKVKEIEYNGKPAWEVVLDEGYGGYGPEAPNHATIVVDQEVGLPVSVKLARDGKLVQTFEMRKLTINPIFTDAQFKVRVPKNATVSNNNYGYKRTSMDKVSSLAGYKPYVLTGEFEGFQLNTVSVGDKEYNGLSGVDDTNIVAMTYRRGIESFTITTRKSGSPTPRDPLDWLEGNVVHNPTTIDNGAFAGPAQHVVWEAGTYSYIWANKGRLILTVTGDLSVDEMRSIAAMLEQSS